MSSCKSFTNFYRLVNNENQLLRSGLLRDEDQNLENEEDIKEIVKFYESSRCSSADVQEAFSN